VKGEIALVIGKGTAALPDTPIDQAVRELEQKGVPRMDAIKQVARERGLSKREVYSKVTG
jgi:16S rRNA C1402 (ribose-2'-O) methylase RsmI